MTDDRSDKDGTRYNSLQRGLQVLALVQDEGRMAVSEISEHLDIPLSTTYRYVRALKNSGFAYEMDGHLIASERLVEADVRSPHLIQLAAPLLWRLRKSTGMTAVLAVRVHAIAVCLDRVLAHPEHRITFGRGAVRSLYSGATALSLLAYAPQKVVKDVLGGGVKPYTSATLTPTIIGPYLEQIRREGYAISYGQVTPGMLGIGVPVVVDGDCICSLSLVGEGSENTPDVERPVEILMAAAAELAEQLVTNGNREVWVGTDDGAE